MKSISFLAAIFAITLFVACNADEPASVEQPLAIDEFFNSEPRSVANPVHAVLTAFERDYPNAIDVNWELSNTIYHATFNVSGALASGTMNAPSAAGTHTNEAYYNTNGAQVQSERDINPADLPQAVKDALSRDYPDYRIDDAEIITRGAETFYEVELEKANQEIELCINPDGTYRTEDPARGNADGLQAAKTHFAANYPNARDAEWKVFNAFIRVEFEQVENNRETDYEIIYTSAGEFQKIKTEISVQQLPQAVQTAINQYIAGKAGANAEIEIDDVWEVTAANGTKSYAALVEVESGNSEMEYYLELNADGTITKETAHEDN
ncbi:MAG: PepSY-like domain-containing protein [Prevotellaceae bacterium]|jgi:hypothetical protein|nr:PepSY-like domain-containing protein [Prevotellaceae bacterium]